MSGSDKNTTASIFENALATTARIADKDAGPGMHNTLFCTQCGAARERTDESLVCRYCGHLLRRATR